MSSDLTSWTTSPPDRWDAFYVRVTQEESVRTDLSIPNQIAREHEIAAARGWTNYQVYVEPKHVSGELWLDKRPGLKRLVEDIRAGRVTRVCARHTDRLWRNCRDPVEAPADPARARRRALGLRAPARLPEPGPMDHAITIEHRFRLGRGSATAADWAAEENAKGRVCACGCGGRIRVLSQHRWHGIPRYLRAHHPMLMSVEVADLRASGSMTSKEAARVLGIGVTTLIRMEGVAYPRVPRRGRRGLRVFSLEVVEKVRECLAEIGSAHGALRVCGSSPSAGGATSSQS